MLTHEEKVLRKGFIDDVSAPIQVLQEPYFTQRVELFEKDFGTLTDYKEYLSVIDKYSGGNIMVFRDILRSLKDKIISSVNNSGAYKDFCANDNLIKSLRKLTFKVGNTNLYTEVNKDCYFVSFDLKKANFQALQWINPAIVLDCDTYDEFIGKFTDINWLAKSKISRQYIFGSLSSSNRLGSVEKQIIFDVEQFLSKTVLVDFFDLFSMNNDEIIYKLKPDYDFKESVKAVSSIITEDFLKDNLSFNVRIEFFKLVRYTFKSVESDKEQNVYVKEKTTGKKDYKCANTIYMPQTYKLINGIEVTDDDLVFYQNDCETAKFFNKLIFVGK